MAEALAKYFRNKRFKVIYVKHIHHGDYNVDYSSKDTGRLLEAGVDAVSAMSDVRIYLNSKIGHNLYKEFLRRLIDEFDVAIFEGIPDIEVDVFDYVINIVDSECRRSIPYQYKDYIEIDRSKLYDSFDEVFKYIINQLMEQLL